MSKKKKNHKVAINPAIIVGAAATRVIDNERERIVNEVKDSGLQHNYRLIMRIVRDLP